MNVCLPEGPKIFLLSTVCRTALGSIGYSVSFPGVKASKYEADLSYPSVAKVKNVS